MQHVKLLKEAACPAQLQGHISKLALPIRGDVRASSVCRQLTELPVHDNRLWVKRLIEKWA